jgi:integrase
LGSPLLALGIERRHVGVQPVSRTSIDGRLNHPLRDLAADELELRMFELLAGAAVFHASQVRQFDLHLVDGQLRYLFPSPRTGERPMSDNGVLSALRRMGFPSDEMTGHGFRAMARTLLAERLNVDEAVIEAQLAHAVKDSLGRAYNRTEFLEQRRKMLQTWADYLDKLRTGAEIIPIKRIRIRSAVRTPIVDKS